jgi:Uma2 family endonuclease
VAGRILAFLWKQCEKAPVGWPLPDGTAFQCFADDPDKVRKPDVSFIAINRITEEQIRDRGHVKIHPDFAVEVLSPNDNAYEVQERVQDFLDAGTRLFWVVNPEARITHVYRHDGSGVILREHDQLTGEDVVPGFVVTVAEILALPPGAPVATPT